MRRPRYPAPRSILITGASSGIGAALACHYAADGVSLFLGGRDAGRLEAVAAGCRSRGARVHPWLGEVTDRDGMRRWIETADAEQPLNLVVANAGAALGAATVAGLQDAASKSFEVNVGGVFNTVHPALELMARRRPYPVCDAQVAIMSSIMGYLGTARSPAYSSSKAAVKAYGEALRGALRNLGIGVSVICPGYVASGMINRPMPFIIPAERAAAIIAGGLARNQARITFPWQVRWLGRLVECLPNRLVDRFNRPWGVPGLEEQPEMENDT